MGRHYETLRDKFLADIGNPQGADRDRAIAAFDQTLLAAQALFADASADLAATVREIAKGIFDPMVECPAKGCGGKTGLCGLCGTEGQVRRSTAEEYLYGRR